jgi:hypothetical protein
MSTPGFRTRKSDIMDTISGIGVGFIHFPPTIAGATLGAAAEPVSIDVVDVDPALLRLPLLPPALLMRDKIAADPADRPNSESTGQLIVTFSEQLRRQSRSAKAASPSNLAPLTEILSGIDEHIPERFRNQVCGHWLVHVDLGRQDLIDSLHFGQVSTPGSKQHRLKPDVLSEQTKHC